MTLAFLNNIGMGELLVILAIVLVVFGAKRLPEIARSIGQSVSEFKKGISDAKDEVKNAVEIDNARTTASNTQNNTANQNNNAQANKQTTSV